MAEYLNAHMKEIILGVAAGQGFVEALLDDMPEKLQPVRKYIKTIKTFYEKILQECERGIDDDQLIGLFRLLNNSEFLIVPRSDVRVGKEFIVADAAQIERILKNSLSDCAVCMYNEGEVKRCQLRKELLQCGVIPRQNGRGHCPFQF